MIDYEHIKIAALDYPLHLVQEMANEPHRYMTEKNEKYARIEDYSKILG